MVAIDTCDYYGAYYANCGEVYDWSSGSGLNLAWTIPPLSPTQYSGSQVVSASVDAQGHHYVLADAPGYQYYYYGGTSVLFYDDLYYPIATFEGFPIDVDVAPDGSLVIATTGSFYYGCSGYYSLSCGEVYRWSLSGGVEHLFTLPIPDPNEDAYSIVAVSADPNGDVYTLRTLSGYYSYAASSDLSRVYRNDEETPLFSLDRKGVDLDVDWCGAVYVATGSADTGYYYTTMCSGGLDCGTAYRWDAAQGVQVLFNAPAIPGQQNYELSNISVDRSGNVYTLGVSPDWYYLAYGGVDITVLYENNVPIASFEDIGVDVDVASFEPTFTNLGSWKYGSLGIPCLLGEGPLLVGSAGTLSVIDGAPGSTVNLVIGLGFLGLPRFKGGTLVPTPDSIVYGLPLDGSGSLHLPFITPPGMPPGFEFFMQGWIPDAGAAPQCCSATNGLRITAP